MPDDRPIHRLCYGALHVVLRDDYAALPHSLERPGAADEIESHIDWQRTMALRTDIDRYGVGVAEAMDTAQRFFIGWGAAQRLIAETGALRLSNGFCAGAGTDQLDAVRSSADLVDAVVEQCDYIAGHGGVPVILPMPWLCAQGAGEREFVAVYEAIIRQLRGPVFLHWLGPMFLPALEGYFPGRSFEQVMAIDPSVVRGCKLSLLDAAFEERVRRDLLRCEQIVLTGDDFHFGRMMLGADDADDATRTTTIGERTVQLGDFSHALLGIFDAIAAPTQQALARLRAGDRAAFLQIMERCEALGQCVFEAPTQHYKAGLAFLAWLNGLQDNHLLVNREDRARDRAHLLRCAELAKAAGCVRDAELFEQRLRAFSAEAPPA